MCDQTEVSYLEDDVVWVKIGPIWWPGVVKDLEKDDVGKEILASLKKKPIAAVKFFQEDNYEFVKNLDHIYHYTCRRKDEFIKKGLDKFRTGAPHMQKFPTDVTTAESLTNGDVNIINDPKFYPEKKESYSEIFGCGKKKSKKDSESSSRPRGRPPAHVTPLRQITHQRFINKVLHGESDHRVKTLIQCNSSPDDGASKNPYKCHICKFETSRVNVIVAHHRLSHSSKNSINWTGSDDRIVRRKPSYKSRKLKTKKLFETSKDEMSEDEDYEKPKISKSKVAKEKLKSPEKNKNESPLSSPSKRKSKEDTVDSSDPKKPRFTDVLLADWDEDEEEEKTDKDEKEKDENNSEDRKSKDENIIPSNEHPEKPDSSPSLRKNQNEKMSCFDFDEEEEGFIGMSNANTYGRKIPRVIPLKDKSDLGMDLEIEELFKKKSESELETSQEDFSKSEESEDNKNLSEVESGEANENDSENNENPTQPKGPGRRRRSKSSKEEEAKVNNEDSLALRRTRRPGAKKSYLNEIIEKVDDEESNPENEKKESEKGETKNKTENKGIKEEAGSSSRRKQDFKHHTLEGDKEEIVYSEIVPSEHKTKTESEKRKTKTQSKDSRRDNSEDLTSQIDSLLEETKLPNLPEMSESSVENLEKPEEHKSINFSFDYLPSEQIGKRALKSSKEVKSISKMFSDCLPKEPDNDSTSAGSSQDEFQGAESKDSLEEKRSGGVGQGKAVNLKFSSANANTAQKRGSIVLSSVPGTCEGSVAKVKVLPVLRQGNTGKDCIVLPAGKKLKGLEDPEQSTSETEANRLKNVKAIKVKTDSLPPSLITAGKLKGQTIIHQKGGKYVIVTQSPPLGRQKASTGKVQSGSKVVILTNQLGEQKIITTSGLQQSKYKVEGQKIITSSDSVTDKEASTSTSTSTAGQALPVIKMVPDGKGGIMKQLTVSPKKVLLGGTKVLVSASGSTFSSGNTVQKITLSSGGGVARSAGGDYRLIENYKGSGKTVLIQGSSNPGSGVVLKSAAGVPRQVTKVIQSPQTAPALKKKPKILMRASTSQGEYVVQPSESPTFVVKQKGTDGKFSTQKIVRTELVNQPKGSLSGSATKAFVISGQSSNKKGESYIITTNESVPGKVIRMRQKLKEPSVGGSPKTQKVVQKNPEIYTISQNDLLLPAETSNEAETPQIVQIQDQSQQPVLQTQVIAMPGPVGADGNQTYVLVSVDENGVVQSMDNSVVAYDATAQPDPIFVNPASTSNVILINPQTNEEATPVFSTSSQDILAEALANTNVLEGTINNDMDSVVPSILLPPSIPSSVVQETSITLQKPIMTPLEMPSSVAPDTSGLEPPPLPPTPTEEDVLMEESEITGGVLQEQLQHQKKEETSSAEALQTYLDPGNFDTSKPTESSFQVEDQKLFEQSEDREEASKKVTEFYHSEELNENSAAQDESKEIHQQAFMMENSQEQSANSFQSLPILNDEPDTSDDVQGPESITEQQFDMEKSRAEPDQFSQLLREQEPPSSTNNEIMSERNQVPKFEGSKYESYHQSYESESNDKDPKSKDFEERVLDEQNEGQKEKEQNGNREIQSLPIIADENNVNSYEIDPIYTDVISQKRFQEETEVSSTTDEFSNKDVTN